MRIRLLGKAIRLVLGLFSLSVLSYVFAFPVFGAAIPESLGIPQLKDTSMRGVMVKAVSTNPDVQAKWHAFQASRYDQEMAKSGYRPKVDFTASVGRDSLNGDGYSTSELYDFNRNGVSVFVTQMLYDGNYTHNSVKRYNHAMKMRYFDLLTTMEQTALMAVHAQANYLRYSSLVELARENLDRHADLMKKVEERTLAGVDSAVNLETAKGRLALARVNLITEESNLHDTVTQYVRIVGETPPPGIWDMEVELVLPSSPETGAEAAMSNNSLILSYGENSNLMRYVIEEQRASFRPHLELRAGATYETNAGGMDGWRSKSYIELVLMFNLYNGGRDTASLHKATEQHSESLEILKKLKRDITQSVFISHNDIQSYEKQLPNLKQHSISSNVTRNAYRQQFEAGRRSLLDLLDSENEFYQAELAYVNASYNQKIAKSDYLAATGALLQNYNVERDDVPTKAEIGYKPVSEKTVSRK